MIAVIGCKKEEPVQPPATPKVDLQKLGEQAGQAAEETKQDAGKALENAGKELQK